MSSQTSAGLLRLPAVERSPILSATFCCAALKSFEDDELVVVPQPASTGGSGRRSHGARIGPSVAAALRLGRLAEAMSERDTVPRGRHAPPLEVRRTASAAAERGGGRRRSPAWATRTRPRRHRPRGRACRRPRSTSTSATRRSASSALFDRGDGALIGAMQAARPPGAGRHARPAERYRRSIRRPAQVDRRVPRPRADAAGRDHRRRPARRRAPRRDPRRHRRLHRAAQRRGRRGRAARRALASPDDAYAVVGATLELASRQIRTGDPGGHHGPRAGHRAPDPGRADRRRGPAAPLREHPRRRARRCSGWRTSRAARSSPRAWRRRGSSSSRSAAASRSPAPRRRTGCAPATAPRSRRSCRPSP